MDCHLIQIMYPTNKKHPSKFLLQHGFCTLETWSKTDPQGLRGRFVVLPHASRVRCDKAVWDVKKGTAGNLEDHPWTCTSETLLGSLLFNRDPYNSLLQSPHNWVVYSPISTLNNQGFFNGYFLESTFSFQGSFPAFESNDQLVADGKVAMCKPRGRLRDYDRTFQGVWCCTKIGQDL